MAAISFRQSFLGESGVAGGLYGGVIPRYPAGSLPSLQATSLEQQLGRDIRLRRVATIGGLGPLSLGASRASANEARDSVASVTQCR